MKKVKFLKGRKVKDENGNVLESFEAGKAYNMKDEKADRWLKRTYCEEVVEAKNAGQASAEKETVAKEKKASK